jgi:hypothetical protein
MSEVDENNYLLGISQNAHLLESIYRRIRKYNFWGQDYYSDFRQHFP